MDPTLAEIYGTNQVEEADVEKLAAAELAEQLSESGDVELDDDTLEALAADVLAQSEETEEQAEGEEPEMQADGAEGEEVEEPAVEGEEEVAIEEPTEKLSAAESEEAQEKIAEADYLGRVMAHAYVQEMRGIEKEAMEKVADEGDVIPEVAKKQALHPGAGGGSSTFGQRAKAALKNPGQTAKNMARAGGQYLAGGAGAKGAKERILGKAGQRLRVAGTRGAAVAAVGGAAYGAKKLFGKGKEKKSFSTTDEGHKLDAAKAKGTKDNQGQRAAAIQEYRKKAPFRSYLLHGFGTEPIHKLTARHAQYREKKHNKGQNPLNPFGGLMTKTPYEKDKKSSALDTLAEQRALEVLAEAGYDVDAVINAVQSIEAPEQEKVSEAEGVNPYDVLSAKVDERAEEMLNGLVEAGIIALPEETEEQE